MAYKVCQDQAQTFGSQCPKFHPNRFTFGVFIAERVKAVLWAYTINPLFARRPIGTTFGIKQKIKIAISRPPLERFRRNLAG